MDSVIMIVIFLIYIAGLIVMVSMGSKATSFEDFAVGGRMFTWPFITMTIIGTSYAGSVLTGYTQMGHDIGMTVAYYTTAVILGLAVFAIICGPVWRVGHKYGVTTLGEMLEMRYGSRGLRIVLGLVLLVIEVPWIITEFLAAGYAVQLITGGAISFNMGMIIIAIFFIGYILFAGMKAVILADYYQGWIFFVAGTFVFIIAMVTHFGGWSEMWEMTKAHTPELLAVPGSLESWGGEHPGSLFYPSLIITAALGAYLYPSLFSRMLAAKDMKSLKISLQIMPIVAVFFGIVVFFFAIGSASLGEFGLLDSAMSFIEFIGSLGPVATALIAIIIIAGSLSMMDSMISSWAIVFTNDVLSPVSHKFSSQKKVAIARTFTVIIGVAGLLLAMTDLPTVVQIVTRVYQVMLQAFPVVVLGIMWKKGSLVGAWAGFLSGCVVVVYFAYINVQPDYIPMFNGMQSGIVGLIVNLVVYVVLSLIFTKGRASDEFFETLNPKRGKKKILEAQE